MQYDVYSRKGDELQRIVVLKGAKIPTLFADTDWTLLGSPTNVADDIAQDVARNGFYAYRTGLTFDERETIGKM